jgi:hypothetical protein
VVDVKSMMTLLHNNILPIHAIPRSLGTQWQQEPVTLEDALGNRIPLPLELVNSWDVS